jgi:predicted Zn finger-like uncharacterized protein
MPIEVTCPHCLSIYNLRDEMGGKTVRCKKCENTFMARAGGKAKPAAADEGPPPRQGVQATRGAPARSRRDPDDEDDRPRRRRRDDDEDDAPLPPPRKKGSVLPWVLGGIGAGLLVILVLCGGLAYWFVHAAGNAINDAVAAADAQAAQDMGGQPGVNMPQNLGPPPQNLDQALTDLRGTNGGRRWVAVTWLADQNLDEARRNEVLQALEPLLTGQDGLVTGGAAKVYARWSTREQVPTLLRLLDSQSHEARAAAIEALGRFKDERAAAPLAARLPDFFDRQAAGKALEALGPVAEKEVAKYVFHKDGGARDEARRLLRVYGTKDSELFTQALTALKDSEHETRKGAADWLLNAQPDPQRAAEVTKALEPVLDDSDPWTSEAAGKALCRWATRDNVPTLIKCLGHRSHEVRKAAGTALGNLKDERAVSALARRLTNLAEVHDIGVTLEAMGPAAAEKEVVKYYFDKNHFAQEEARRILKAWGTKQEVIADQAILDLKDAGNDERQQINILNWLAQAQPDDKRRADAGPALDPPLKSSSRFLREAALKAAVPWGSKDNVPALVSVLDDQRITNNDLRLLAIQALGKIKDDRAAPALTVSLLNPSDRDQAANALLAIGPGAEKPVLTGLKNKDPLVRVLACRILKVIGTKDSLKDLETCAAKDPVPAVRPEARAAADAIKAR